MKKRELTLALAILLFTAAPVFPAPSFENTPCSERSIREIKVPEDFRIVYESGDSHAGRPGRRTHIEIGANGTLKYFDGFTKGGHPRLQLQQRRISPENVARIYAKVLDCEFFRLKEHYNNPRVFGGWSSYIFVSASGKNHSVAMSNISARRFDAIRKILHEETGI